MFFQLIQYSLSPREIPRAEPDGFPEGSGYISQYIQLESQYKHFHLPYNGSAAAVSYAAVTAIADIVNAGVAVELDA